MSEKAVQTITINQGNFEKTDVHQLTLRLGRHAQLQNHQVAVSSIVVPYSWFNITAVELNNTFGYTWPSATPVVVPITIPDSFLEINQISDYLHFVMLQNKHYYLDAASEPVYLIRWLVNVSQYTVTFIFDPLLTNANMTAAGYTIPAGATWTNPVADALPTLDVTNANFGLLLGQSPATLGGGPAVHTEFNGDLVPAIQPATSLSMECNLVSNDLQISRTIFSFAPNTAFGGYIRITPPFPIWFNVLSGSYPSIVVSFVDQRGKKLPLVDLDIQVQLIVREVDI